MEHAVTVETARIEHLLAISPAEPIPHLEDWMARMTHPSMEPYLEVWARTLLHNDRVLGVVGLNPVHLGVGELWGFFSREGGPAVALVRALRRLIDHAFETSGCWRIQVAVQHDFTMGARLIEILGFELEATLRHYLFPGSRDLLYSRCRV